MLHIYIYLYTGIHELLQTLTIALPNTSTYHHIQTNLYKSD